METYCGVLAIKSVNPRLLRDEVDEEELKSASESLRDIALSNTSRDRTWSIGEHDGNIFGQSMRKMVDRWNGQYRWICFW